MMSRFWTENGINITKLWNTIERAELGELKGMFLEISLRLLVNKY